VSANGLARTALHYAASKGHHQTSKVLIKLTTHYLADGRNNARGRLLPDLSLYNANDIDETTTLHYAAFNGDDSMVQLLVGYGKDDIIAGNNRSQKYPK